KLRPCSCAVDMSCGELPRSKFRRLEPCKLANQKVIRVQPLKISAGFGRRRADNFRCATLKGNPRREGTNDINNDDYGANRDPSIHIYDRHYMRSFTVKSPTCKDIFPPPAALSSA
ncbi:MAG TPA: hypothetical protein VFC19_01495, partial [Candidatus Limnocylindrales bacterium]|nr:hypothetical protein [Candidatus Limnocylindrales bacterium]